MVLKLIFPEYLDGFEFIICQTYIHNFFVCRLFDYHNKARENIH